ncbi:MAG: DUF2283 domain-containing protein [Gaiellaceae bacterium]
MKVTYDASVDVAYVQLADRIGIRGVAWTETGESDQTYTVNLDYDKDGRLLGIEVLNATERLPPGFLERFGNRELRAS